MIALTEVMMTEYIVLRVTRKSKHPAASYVEGGFDDDSMLIVQQRGDKDIWWEAREFFYSEDIKEFKVTK